MNHLMMPYRLFRGENVVFPVTSRRIFFSLFVLSLASCSSAPHFRKASVDYPQPGAGKREKIVQEAKSYIGTRYVLGGASRDGVDCSGLLLAVFRSAGIRLPRTASEQARTGNLVSRKQLKPGDLVFFHTSSWKKISHAGIYIGKGDFIHASTRARRVRIDSIESPYFRRRFVLARSLPQLD